MGEDSTDSLTLRVAKAIPSDVGHGRARVPFDNCLLYTSDAADE